jgi:peptidoglycan/LPS O-acetylase OafA/YrhL
MVVLTHVGFLTGEVSQGLVGRLLGRGDLGVAIFFALSGFLLHSSMLREYARSRTVDVRGYLRRRGTRILPAFWLGLVVVAVAVRPPLDMFVANVTLTQIYFPGALMPGYTQTWSLATEASFYLALPFVFLWLRSRLGDGGLRATALAWSWVLGVVAAALSGLLVIGGEELAGRWLPAHWPSFVLGMVLAELFVAPNRATRMLDRLADHPGTCLLLAGAAYLLATTTVAGPLTLGPIAGLQVAGKAVLATFVAGGLMVPLVFGSRPNGYVQLLASGPARYLGAISYGVFLWHLPIFEGLYHVTSLDYFSGGAAVLLAVGLPIAVGVAAASERWLERPLMDRVHARHGSRSATPPVTARTTP